MAVNATTNSARPLWDLTVEQVLPALLKKQLQVRVPSQLFKLTRLYKDPQGQQSYCCRLFCWQCTNLNKTQLLLPSPSRHREVNCTKIGQSRAHYGQQLILICSRGKSADKIRLRNKDKDTLADILTSTH